jgi:hypothetical protein
MSRIHVATRGICNWRERLANPDRQWKRGFSAFETAVAWECASSEESQLPQPIRTALVNGGFDAPKLLFAVAEHKVPLRGGRTASQSDVWAVVSTSKGMLSLSVEAKANEAFGDQTLEKWFEGTSEQSKANRQERWKHLVQYLPDAPTDHYHPIRYQMLHRCAASVIEADRFGLPHASFVVQAFGSPDASFQEYKAFCQAIGVPPARGSLTTASKARLGISLSIGWVDCPFATDSDIASIAA